MALRVALGVAVWLAAHVTVVGWASAGSRETTLAVGEVKRFCGFYLDCHLRAQVHSVDREGAVLVVTLRISNTAARAQLTPHGLTAVVRDAQGAEYRPMDPALDTGSPVPANGERLSPLRFAVPENVQAPRLLVRMGTWPDRVVELLLPGDEDSLWHARTWFALNQRT